MLQTLTSRAEFASKMHAREIAEIPQASGEILMTDKYRTIDKFDRMLGALDQLPDVTRTKPSTITVLSPLIGAAQTFIVQTLRQREIGDTIFIQYVDDNGAVRIAIPPADAEAIARQKDALTIKVRKRVGKESAKARAARGELPGFMAKGKRKKTHEEGKQ